MTTWTEVTDPTTLKEGDHIKIVSGVLVVEGTRGDEKVQEDSGFWRFDIEELDEYLHVSTGDSKFFLAEPKFAPLGRALEPGEVVEDPTGRKYTINPLNPALVIHSYSGLTATEEFIYESVRPVR